MRPRAVIVVAASIALRMASSVASMTASKSGFMAAFVSVRTSATTAASGGASRRAKPRLPVAKAIARSPLEFSPTPPVRAIPNVARWASRRHCSGSSGASVATTTMIDPLPAGSGPSDARHGVEPDLQPHGDAVDGEPFAPAVVGLDEDSDDVVAGPARGGADPALEVVADHPGAAADGALVDRTSRRGGVGLARVVGGHVEAVDVVEVAVPRLGDHGQRPRLDAGRQLLDLDRDQGVAHDPHAVGVRDGDRRVQQADLLEPRQPGHLAVAVEPVVRRVDRVAPHVPLVRHDDRHAGAHSVALEHRGVADADAGHVGDRIVRARLERADPDAEARARSPVMRAPHAPGAGGSAPTRAGRRRAPARRRCGSRRAARRGEW